MTLILGIDPGSRITGYGLILTSINNNKYIASGCIRTGKLALLAERLRVIYSEVHALITAHHPQEVAIEDVFVARSPAAALKLGHARAAALLAAANCDLPITAYQPRKIKKAVVGTGAATKEQVQWMVRMLLRLTTTPQEDAADALATAICHAHYRQLNIVEPAAGSVRHPGRSRRTARVRRGRIS